MAYEIINTLRSKSVIRVTGNTATTIALSALSANPSTETVVEASLSYASATTDGIWSIYRGDDTNGSLILELVGNVTFPLSHHDMSFANTPTANIHITNSGSGGTLILQVSKYATYDPALIGM